MPTPGGQFTRRKGRFSRLAVNELRSFVFRARFTRVEIGYVRAAGAKQGGTGGRGACGR